MAEPDRLLDQVENAGGRGVGWLWLLLGWILSRNLLEGILERPRTLGFDWREDISASMVFLHFPIFYLFLFAGVALLLHLVARRPLEAVARAVALAFGLLLVAPLIDAVVSRGRGYDLNYLLGFGSTLWRLWDPGTPLHEVSPGQRIEIVLACLLGGTYVWAARRRASRESERPAGALVFALIGAIGVYLLAAFAGAWPSLYARWTAGQHAVGASVAADAYAATFRGPGLIASESRRHALIMALPLLALLPVLAWRADPRRFRAIVSRLPWTRLTYYAGLVPAGVFLGWSLYHEFLPLHSPLGLYGPIDPAAIAVLTVAMLSAVLAAVCWNDLADLEVDRVNECSRPLPSGVIDPAEVTRLGRAFAAGALFLGLCVSYVAFLLILASLFLAWIYSSPPLRLKRVPFVATGLLGLLSLLSLTTGFSLFAQENAPTVLPARIALALFAGVLLGFPAKDLKDREGDRAHGIVTLATLLPAPRARRATAVLVAAGYLLVPWLLPFGWTLAAVSVLFAATGATITLRRSRPDSALLASFCLFAAIVLGFVAHDPEPLRGRVPRALIEGQSDLLRPDREEAALRLQAEPLNVGAHQRLVEASFLRGDYPGALEASANALALGLRPGWFLRQAAAATLAAGEPDPGLSAENWNMVRVHRSRLAHEIRGAALLQSANAPLYVLAGDRLRLAGRAEAAASADRQAIRIDPENADAWAGLGEIAHAAGQIDPAIAAFRHAAELRPSDPWIHNNLGVALRDAGRAPEARAEFEEARRLAPEMFEPIFNLALSAEVEGRKTEALSLCRLAEQRRPHFGPLQALLRRLEAPKSATPAP